MVPGAIRQRLSERQCAAYGLLAALICGSVYAQDAATKPRRMVTIEAGGGNDTVARLVALGWGHQLGQRVIVENRGGASGIIAGESVVKAAPDGLTLLSMSGSLWLLPFMQHVPYDPVKDLLPVTQSVTSPNVLVVNPALPVKSVKELIALEVVSTYGVFVPAKTPAAVVARIHQEIVRGLQTAEIRERFFAAGSEVVASSPQEFAAVISAEQSKLGKLIRDVNIRSQ